MSQAGYLEDESTQEFEIHPMEDEDHTKMCAICADDQHVPLVPLHDELVCKPCLGSYVKIMSDLNMQYAILSSLDEEYKEKGEESPYKDILSNIESLLDAESDEEEEESKEEEEEEWPVKRRKFGITKDQESFLEDIRDGVWLK